MADRIIYAFCETAFECPECSRRLDFDEPVDHDEDGPIYEGTCLVHGVFLVQSVEEADEDDD